jgi:hypothetical protein
MEAATVRQHCPDQRAIDVGVPAYYQLCLTASRAARRLRKRISPQTPLTLYRLQDKRAVEFIAAPSPLNAFDVYLYVRPIVVLLAEAPMT